MSDPKSAKARIWAEHEERIDARLHALDPDLARYVTGFAYGEVYERPGLDLRTKELLACVMLLALGSPEELRTHLRGALRVGATERELRETLLFAAPYLGFPRVIAAFAQLRDVLAKEAVDTTNPAPGEGGGEEGGL